MTSPPTGVKDLVLDQWIAFRIDKPTMSRLNRVSTNRSSFIRDLIERALTVSERTLRTSP